jgi:ABC-type bacteriocin/lantibiotic exporter with double-glycine peptidase domain
MLDVPFVPQEKNACGAASISMVMDYWARAQEKPGRTDAAAIQRELYSDKAKGIFASDLQRFFERHGFRSFAFRGGWDDLHQHLAKGRPLIVALGDAGRSSPLHYVVVTGIDSSQRLVFINDPARRKAASADWPDFERDWAVTDHWTLLAVPN